METHDFHFFPQALLGGFSFRAGEHTTSAVREIAGPNQNGYNFRKKTDWKPDWKPARKTCPLDFWRQLHTFGTFRIAKTCPKNVPARFLTTVTHFWHFSNCTNVTEKCAHSIWGPWSLVPGPWSLVPGSMVPGPWSLGPKYHLVGFRNIVLSWMRCFGGLVSSQRYRNQQLEIYNFRVVPGFQISKEVYF